MTKREKRDVDGLSPERRAQKLRAVLRHGTRLLQDGQAQKAAPFLERAHELDPTNLDAALNLGGAYILLKKFKQAVAVLRPLSEQYPQNGMVWTNLGAAFLGNPVLARDEEQQRALAAFKRALAVQPGAPNVAYNIALIYRDRQEIDKAIHWFRRAVQANPQDQDARRLLAKLTTENNLEEEE